MTEREKIGEKFHENIAKILELEAQNIELQKQNYLLCDDKQWFVEKEEEVLVSKRPNRTDTMLIGRVHWKEFFKDDSSEDGVWIERNRIVRVNGEWEIDK